MELSTLEGVRCAYHRFIAPRSQDLQELIQQIFDLQAEMNMLTNELRSKKIEVEDSDSDESDYDESDEFECDHSESDESESDEIKCDDSESKGVNPGGDVDDVSPPPCFDMGGITCLLSPPCFDPQICCFLAWKINNIL